MMDDLDDNNDELNLYDDLEEVGDRLEGGFWWFLLKKFLLVGSEAAGDGGE
jgi:hypothetical protein